MSRLADIQNAFEQVRQALGWAESDRVRVFLTVEFLKTVLEHTSLLDAYAEELLPDLPESIAADEFVGIAPEVLVEAADVLEGAAMGLGNDAVGTLRQTRVTRVAEALAAAAEFPGIDSTPGLWIALRERGPAGEAVAIRPCRVQVRQIRRTSGADGDAVVLSGASLDAERRVNTRLHRSVLVARRLLDVGPGDRFSGSLVLASPATMEGVEMANLGLSLLCVSGMSGLLATAHRVRLEDGVAAIGDVGLDGRASLSVDFDVPAHVRAVFYSPASALVVPRESVDVAESTIRGLKETWPHRDLPVVGVAYARDALSDRRLFARERRPLMARLGLLLSRYRMAVAALAVVVLTGCLLLVSGVSPRAWLQARAPGAAWGTEFEEAAGSTGAAITHLVSSGESGVLGVGWSGGPSQPRTLVVSRIRIPPSGVSEAGASTNDPGRASAANRDAAHVRAPENARVTLVALEGDAKASDVLVDGEGRLVIAGNLTTGGRTMPFITRLGPDFERDLSFERVATEALRALSHLESVCRVGDGYALTGETLISGEPRATVVAIDGTGGLVISFGSGGRYVYPARSSGRTCLGDGKGVFLGGQTSGSTGSVAFLAKLTQRGQLDRGFGDSGQVVYDWGPLAGDHIHALETLNRGQLAMLGLSTWGNDTQVVVARLDARTGLAQGGEDTEVGLRTAPGGPAAEPRPIAAKPLLDQRLGAAMHREPGMILDRAGRLAVLYAARDLLDPGSREPKQDHDGALLFLGSGGDSGPLAGDGDQLATEGGAQAAEVGAQEGGGGLPEGDGGVPKGDDALADDVHIIDRWIFDAGEEDTVYLSLVEVEEGRYVAGGYSAEPEGIRPLLLLLDPTYRTATPIPPRIEI